MDNNNKKAIKSGMLYTLSNFFTRSIGLITTPIFTRLLTKSEFGLYNNYLSWTSLFLIIVTLNLDATLISAKYDYEDKFDEYIYSVLTLSTASTCAWLIITNSFYTFFETFLGMDRICINAMLIYLLFFSAITLFQARERYYFEYKISAITSVILSLGTAFLSVILVMEMKDKLYGRIFGSVVPVIIIGAICYIFFIGKGKKIKIDYWKYAIPICIPYIPHLLSLNLLNSMDRIMINKWCGSEDAALYSLAYTCGSLVTLLMVSMNSAYAPWLGEKLAANDFYSIRKFSRIYILAFSFLAMGLMLIAPELLYILGGESYADAKYVMTPVAMGCVCQFLYTMFVNIEQFKKKTVGMAFASVLGALVNYVLNYLMIPRIGYLAAAYTTLVGYLCLLVVHMYLVYRLNYSKAYNYKMVIVVVVSMILITFLISFLYSNFVMRYAVVIGYITIFFMLLIKKKTKILSLVKRRN